MAKKTRQAARKAGYDSAFEMDLHYGPLKDAEYHPANVSYEIPAKISSYEPDFKIGNYLIEAKGRFRDMTEAKKYEYVIDSIRGTGLELVFLFYNPKTPLPGAQRRKDGTKRSHAEWADAQGIAYYTADTVIDLISKA